MILFHHNWLAQFHLFILFWSSFHLHIQKKESLFPVVEDNPVVEDTEFHMEKNRAWTFLYMMYCQCRVRGNSQLIVTIACEKLHDTTQPTHTYSDGV